MSSAATSAGFAQGSAVAMPADSRPTASNADVIECMCKSPRTTAASVPGGRFDGKPSAAVCRLLKHPLQNQLLHIWRALVDLAHPDVAMESAQRLVRGGAGRLCRKQL